MGDKTGIEWTDATWNPTTGCDQVSPGCDHCYALTMAKRLKGMGQPDYQVDGDPRTSGPGFGFQMHPHRLDQPLRWTRPRRIFVNSMSDLFHGSVDRGFLIDVFAVMAASPRHTYQLLTKRPQIARSVLSDRLFPVEVAAAYYDLDVRGGVPEEFPTWPLPNVWLGTSTEDQKRADLRIPHLLETPAAVRFLSCEPLLGPVGLFPYLGVRVNQTGDRWEHGSVDWVIVGGESGREARPMHPDWVRSIRDECVAQGVAFHFKQWGEWAPHRLDGGRYVNVRVSQTRDQYESARFATDGTPYVASQPDLYSYPGMASMLRVGKRKAGRELDGRTWDEWPV